MQQNTAAGDTWDAAGGLPDPFVDIILNGVSLGVTSTQEDTLTPTWNQQATAIIAGGSSFQLDVYDSDVTVNDYMFGCLWQPLNAAVIRKVINQCDSFASQPAGLGSSIVFWFEYL